MDGRFCYLQSVGSRIDGRFCHLQSVGARIDGRFCYLQSVRARMDGQFCYLQSVGAKMQMYFLVFHVDIFLSGERIVARHPVFVATIFIGCLRIRG